MRAACLASVMVLQACAAPAPTEPSPSRPWPAPLDSGISLSGGFLLATGEGQPDPAASGETQRRSTSRDAALADARERLRAYLRSLDLAGKREAALNRLAASAEPVSTRWAEEGGAAAVVRVQESRVNEALGTNFR